MSSTYIEFHENEEVHTLNLEDDGTIIVLSSTRAESHIVLPPHLAELVGSGIIDLLNSVKAAVKTVQTTKTHLN